MHFFLNSKVAVILCTVLWVCISTMVHEGEKEKKFGEGNLSRWSQVPWRASHI